MVRIAKRKIRPRQAAAKAERGLEPLAYSIAEFVELHGISIDLYFKLARSGLGPRTMKIGARTLISVESAAAWRRDREQGAPPATPPEPHGHGRRRKAQGEAAAEA
jgi:hypothetical protein